MRTAIKYCRLAALALAGLMPMAAFAHTGVGSVSGLGAGWAHPFSGMDHMLAMFAVGLWAAQLGGRAVWAVPLSFVGMMIAGGALGLSGVHVPLVEAGILASLLVLGLLVAFAVRLPLFAGSLLVGMFALMHGHAHGSEMPAALDGLTYAAGFVAATIALHAAGILAGMALQKLNVERLTRLAGGFVALAGVYLAVS
jgi:urease accessory protein